LPGRDQHKRYKPQRASCGRNRPGAHQLSVIALTGRPGSVLGALADIEICTPAGRFADRVQELHVKVVHILIELVERALFPENYRD
jgi:D-sedoheptulose 7-phosphate isomerase